MQYKVTLLSATATYATVGLTEDVLAGPLLSTDMREMALCATLVFSPWTGVEQQRLGTCSQRNVCPLVIQFGLLPQDVITALDPLVAGSHNRQTVVAVYAGAIMHVSTIYPVRMAIA